LDNGAMKIGHILRATRIDDPKKFRLAGCDTAHTHGIDLDKEAAKQHLADDVERLRDLQERLHAQDRWAVLVILQGMDASGKDGIIKHVMAGINPQGCEVHSFKQPSAEELDHDFLWRCAQRLPARGRIGIFNRSYYEEVLVARVHPDILAHESLPDDVVTPRIWQQRFDDICAFERTLAHNGTLVLKFFLHISKQEQRERFLARIEEPAKRWKFSMDDVAERKLWAHYMAAYEDMIRATSHADGRWYVVPADHKPFARLLVAGAVVDALERLDLEVPKVIGAALRRLNAARKALLAEKPSPKRARKRSRPNR
jgi:PPK2 family polyphosphate:nucleotide phosphotransferase